MVSIKARPGLPVQHKYVTSSDQSRGIMHRDGLRSLMGTYICTGYGQSMHREDLSSCIDRHVKMAMLRHYTNNDVYLAHYVYTLYIVALV